MKITKILHPALLTFVLFACSSQPESKRVDNIQRVFMQSESTYLFMITNEDGTHIVSYKAVNVLFLKDVPPEQPIYAELYSNGYNNCNDGSGDENGYGKWWGKLTIHIHGTAEIEGAGWDQGKQGHGTIHVVE